MFGFSLFLLAGVTLGRAGLHTPSAAPPYVQSRVAYTNVRTYLSEALRPGSGNINTHDGRTHLSFGILAGAAAGMVLANRSHPLYNPLLVLDQTLPYTWRHFDQVAMTTQALLNEASGKIKLIEDLIDNMCDSAGIQQCNAEIQNKVLRNPHVYKLPAELLILLGKASDTIRRHQAKINSVTSTRTEIPYLIKGVSKPEARAFVALLDKVYKKMRQLQYRRFMGPQLDFI